MSATAQLGPRARAVAALRLEGKKRRRVLAAIAAHADAGERSPTIRRLSAELGLQRFVLVSVIARLERDGLLAVDRCGTGPEGGRATYSLNLPHPDANERTDP